MAQGGLLKNGSIIGSRRGDGRLQMSRSLGMATLNGSANNRAGSFAGELPGTE